MASIADFHDRNGHIRHDDFQHWRAKHPRGFYLAFTRRDLARLHGTQCFHMGDPGWTSKYTDSSYTRERKVCSASESTLIAWASTTGITVRPCQHCVRDNFIHLATQLPPKTPAVSPTETTEAVEGLRREMTILSRGRSAALRKSVLASSGGVCEACGTDFSALLSGKGVSALQVHHRKQLALSNVPRVTKSRDLAVVCANCHSLIHMDRQRALPVEQLKQLLHASGT